MDDTCWEVYGGYLKQRRDAGASLKEIGNEVDVPSNGYTKYWLNIMARLTVRGH